MTELECGSSLKPADVQALNALLSAPQLTPPSTATGPYCIPCALHIVRRSDGTGGIDMALIQQGFVDADNYFINTGMDFYLFSIDYIDSDDWYTVSDEAEANALRGQNVVANCINMYFVGELPWAGISSFTWSAAQGIVYHNGYVGQPTNPSTFPHEIGHFFNLLHTHETAICAELVDGSNCAVCGDLLCDTPADPGLGDGNVSAWPACAYTGSATDANGDTYAPDPHQMMSYSRKQCRDDITPQGEAVAVATLLVLRNNLFTNGCPPDADAGPDQIVECTGPVGTSVQMDGSGSSDLDGDPLTYLWSAAGVTFDNNTLVNPTGDFQLGTTAVRLIVTDDIGLSDTDYVDIQIVDTTPPTIVCPADIVIECEGFCGTSEGSMQLADWWNDVSATDVCDLGVDIVDNVADDFCFPKGANTVVFTATDDSGNSSTCSSRVYVVDTTPPVITVTLDRDCLWPPNHKMSEINATVEVTDICCEFPTFDLVSISSNEPDNAKGDGNTVGDIEIISKTKFNLRSERRGGHEGRTYTIVHIASDCDGNTATSTVYVQVPHDQSGNAICSTGFTGDGLDLNPQFQKYALVIPSKPGEFDATAIDPKKVFVGNAKAALRPLETLIVDINRDGYNDLAAYYSVQATRDLIEASTQVPEDQMSVFEDWGAIGLHYTSTAGKNYLVSDIFELGTPVILRITIPRRADDPVPSLTSLTAISPNPFNQEAMVEFSLEKEARVKLRVYDTRGALIRTLSDQPFSSGPHFVSWDGLDDGGRPVATGIYFVNFTTGDYRATKKLVLIK
ncbi:MAG: HYR domain-containing protein [Chitinivibrionia bacterium]|nr:HYR domain-containing protein [Chitinivibrionia bacterium]